MTREELTAHMRAALAALVAWHDKVETRRRGKPCACPPPQSRKSQCWACRARRVLARSKSAETLALSLLRLIQAHEAMYGKCDRDECGECLACRGRVALTCHRQMRLGREVTGVQNERRDRRKLGGECKRGHSLTEETAYPRKDGSLACRLCQIQAQRRHRLTHPLPKKSDPRFCRYGIHEMTPENTYTTKQGWRTCRQCKRDSHKTWRKTHRETYLAGRKRNNATYLRRRRAAQQAAA